VKEAFFIAFHQWLWLAFISRAVEMPIDWLLEEAPEAMGFARGIKGRLERVLGPNPSRFWCVAVCVDWLSQFGLPVLILILAGWKVAVAWYLLKLAGTILVTVRSGFAAAGLFPKHSVDFTMLILNPLLALTLGLLSLWLIK
jgi:hypothetical protein